MMLIIILRGKISTAMCTSVQNGLLEKLFNINAGASYKDSWNIFLAELKVLKGNMFQCFNTRTVSIADNFNFLFMPLRCTAEAGR